MLKQAINSIVSSVFSPHTDDNSTSHTDSFIDGAYSRLINHGISNISMRSPILSDIASSTYNAFQTELIKKKKISDYVKSSDSDWLRTNLKNKKPEESDKKIEIEMSKIISKISEQIDKIGVEGVKESGKFKEYEQFFDKFKKTENSKESTSMGEEILHRIESNTKQTVNALESLSIKHESANQQSGDISAQKPSFIDPITGLPSIKHAVSHIGGNFLGKLFDDELIEKLVKKTKNLFETNEKETQLEPENIKKPVQRKRPTKFGKEQTVEKMFPKDLFDLNKSETIQKEQTSINKELVKTVKNLTPKADKVFLSNTHNVDKINSAIETLAPKIFKSSLINKSIINATAGSIKKHDFLHITKDLFSKNIAGHKMHDFAGNYQQTTMQAQQKPNEESTTSKLISTAGSVAQTFGLARLALPLLAGAASLVSLPALAAVGAVGAAGYGGYKLYQENENQNQLISDKVKSIKNLEPNKESKISELQTVQREKNQQIESAKNLNKNQQPVVLNNTNNIPSSGGDNVIVGMSVRNQDSTYERVQMQDFWPRVA